MSDLPRGTVTFLFTDIEGSTRLLQQLGPDYAAALGDHQALLRAAWARPWRHEVGTQGDSFFVVFPSAAAPWPPPPRPSAPWPRTLAGGRRRPRPHGPPHRRAPLPPAQLRRPGCPPRRPHRRRRPWRPGPRSPHATRDLVAGDAARPASACATWASTGSRTSQRARAPLPARHRRPAHRLPAAPHPGRAPTQPAGPAHAAHRPRARGAPRSARAARSVTTCAW